MKLVNTRWSNKYFQMVLDPGEIAPVGYLMGYKVDKTKRVYQVENNLVNRIVLGLDDTPPAADELFHGRNLLDYQVLDVKKMLTTPNCCNFNKMGAGKTVEMLVLMRELKVQNGVIVAPKTVVPQWIHQMQFWYPEAANVVEYQKGVTKITRDTFVVLNYEKLMQTAIITSLKGFAWDVLVVDEAHRIKNPKSQRSRNVDSIPSVRRYALTGSPILNRPTDLWNILHFADWHYAGSAYWNFVYYFCECEKFGEGRRPIGLTKDPAKIAILNRLLERVSVRNPIEVAQGKTITTIRIPMTQKQKTLYYQVRNLVLEQLPEDCTIANGMVQTLRLQQVTSCPSIFADYGEVAGGKFEWVLEACQDHPDETFVVFSRFEKAITALTKYLRKGGIGATTVTGDLTTLERYENINMFTSGKAQVLLGTIGALGIGVDGLQNVCRLAIFLDKDPSPEINAQAEDRLNRYGQKDHVVCYYLECPNTWDQHVARMNLLKASDIRKVLQED